MIRIVAACTIILTLGIGLTLAFNESLAQPADAPEEVH